MFLFKKKNIFLLFLDITIFHVGSVFLSHNVEKYVCVCVYAYTFFFFNQIQSIKCFN